MKSDSHAKERRSARAGAHLAPDTVRPRPGVKIWLFLIALGVLARVAIAAVSLGTNDAAAWLRFGDEIKSSGLIATYQSDPDFNHPPLPGYWAAAAAALAGPQSASHDSLFTNIFKIPVILADCVGIYLLWRIWRRRVGSAAALVIAAFFACSLDAILVSAYHCNTDPIYIMLCLLSIYCIEDHGSYFAGGLALGAAINVKLIPVLLIPMLLLSFRRWRQVGAFVLGLALWVLPFAPVLLRIPRTFFKNALNYNSVLDRWGIDFFLLLGSAGFTDQGAAEHVAAWYYFHARYFIWGLVLALAVWSRWRRDWSRYEVAALTFTIFLVFAPGFGVQYTVLVGLLLFAVRPGWAVAYAWLAGFFIATAYFVYWTGAWPAYSQWRSLFPMPVAAIGVLVWGLLVAYGIAAIAFPAPRDTEQRTAHASR